MKGLFQFREKIEKKITCTQNSNKPSQYNKITNRMRLNLHTFIESIHMYQLHFCAFKQRMTFFWLLSLQWSNELLSWYLLFIYLLFRQHNNKQRKKKGIKQEKKNATNCARCLLFNCFDSLCQMGELSIILLFFFKNTNMPTPINIITYDTISLSPMLTTIKF